MERNGKFEMIMLNKIFNRLRNIFLNNILVNNVLIILKKDYLIKKWKNNWAYIEYDKEKSPEQNVGCSPDFKIQKLARETHSTIKAKTAEHFSNAKSVLDIGCGTGVYLKDFPEHFSLTGIDLNDPFLKVAKHAVPSAKFIKGDYMKIDLEEKYDLIITLGFLMYIEPSTLKDFFQKLNQDLNIGGKIFFQYSHALLLKDVLYSDLSYVRYSPTHIEKVISPFFNIIEHKHFFDNRTVENYDRDRYYFPNGKNNRVDTIQNTYLLIAEKKLHTHI